MSILGGIYRRLWFAPGGRGGIYVSPSEPTPPPGDYFLVNPDGKKLINPDGKKLVSDNP